MHRFDPKARMILLEMLSFGVNGLIVWHIQRECVDMYFISTFVGKKYSSWNQC